MSTVLRSLKMLIGADFSAAQKGFKAAAKEFNATGKQLTSAGKSMTSGITVPVLGAVAGITSLAVSAGNTADELLTMAAKTGLTTDQLQEMEYAARFVDVEVETMTGSVVKLTRSMGMADKGSKTQQESFEKLGISIYDQSGNLRDANDVWLESIDALGKMQNETERDVISMDLFGKSAQELNPLIVAGADSLSKYAEEAHNVGAVIDKDTVKSLGEFDDTMEELEAVFKSSVTAIAAEFTPTLQKLAPIVKDDIVPVFIKLIDKVADIADWFDELNPGMKTAVGVFAGLAVAAGPLLTVTGKLSTGVGSVMTAFANASKAIKGGGGYLDALKAMIGPSGMVMLAVAALAAMAAVMVSITQDSREATNAVMDTVNAARDSSEAFAENTDEVNANAEVAGKLADQLFNLADKTNKTASEQAAMVSVVDQLNDLVPDLNLAYDAQTDSLNLTAQSVRDLITAQKEQFLLEAYKDRIVELYKEQLALTEEQERAQTRLNEAAKEYAKAAFDPNIVARADALYELNEAKKAFEAVTEAVKKNSTAIDNTSVKLTDLSTKLYEAGKNAAKGFADGLNSGSGTVADAATSLARVASRTLTNKLQIQSPSKVFEGYGAFTTQGFAKGMLAGIGNVRSAAASMTSAAMTGAVDMGAPSASYGASSGTQGKGDPVLTDILAAIRAQKPSVSIGNETLDSHFVKASNRMSLQTGR